MSKEIVSIRQIAQSIYLLRGQKVMLDDFMFQLTAAETSNLRSQFVTLSEQTIGNQWAVTNWSQFVTSSRKHRGRVYRPYAFTEQGVAMLSSVLNSERAVKVNIAIMRAFVKLRETLETNRELARKFAELERRVGKHDEKIDAILEAIRQLMTPPKKSLREIGFHVREKTSRYRMRRGQ
jgi:hypothetical protein